MLYTSNRRGFFSNLHTTTHTATHTAVETEVPASFADKHRSLPMRTIALLAGCLVLLMFCVFAMAQIAMQIQTGDIISVAKAVGQNMPGGTLSSIVTSIPQSTN